MFAALIVSAVGLTADPPKTSAAVVAAWTARGATAAGWGDGTLFEVPEAFDAAGLPVPEGPFAVRLTPGAFAAAGLKPVRGAKALGSVTFKKEGKIDAAVVAALREVPGLRELQIWEYVDSDPASLKALGTLTGLESITASTGVTDDVLRAWGPLKKLTALNLTGGRDFSGTGIAALRGLKSLKLNQARGVTDDGVRAFAALTDLESLDLSFSFNVTDKGLAGLSGLKKLTALNLTRTKVSDAGLKLLPPAVARLEIANAGPITDAGLKTLAGFPALTRINISDSGATAAGIAAFKNAVPGCEVVND